MEPVKPLTLRHNQKNSVGFINFLQQHNKRKKSKKITKNKKTAITTKICNNLK